MQRTGYSLDLIQDRLFAGLIDLYVFPTGEDFMRISMHAFQALLFSVLLSVLAVPALAQSPNTAAILVVVVDQTGAVVDDANVAVMNSATGATRDDVSAPKARRPSRRSAADRHLRGSRDQGRLHRRGRRRT